MRCLRCPEVELVEHRGALDEAVCPSCQGRLLDATASARVLEAFCGLERSLLGDMCAHYRGRAPCPACGRSLSSIPVVGVTVDLCGGCGALFLDGGELSRLTAGAVAEVEVAQQTPAAPPPPPPPSPSPPSAPLPSSPTASVVGQRAAVARPAGRDAAVFLRTPLAADAALPLLLEVWQRAAFRTAIDAVGMAPRAVGGIFADDCSEAEAARLVGILSASGCDADVVTDARILPPPPFRQKELGLGEDAIVVTDGLGLQPRSLPLSGITVLAAATARVVVTELAPDGEADGGLLRRAASVMTPRIIQRAAERAEAANRLPTTKLSERAQLFLDVIVGGERFRLDERGFVSRPDGPRTLQALAAALHRVVPATAFRHRGFMALIRGEAPPHLRALRDLDREVAWSMWRQRLD